MAKILFEKTKRGESNWGSIFILLIIIVLGIVWFKNAHPDTHYNGLEDYRDTWFTGTRDVNALYCGKSPNIYCDPSGNWFVAQVTWNGKEKAASGETKWIHDFTIYFPNGGWVETEATCDKAATGWYSYDRFCNATAYDEYGNATVFLITPRN